MSTDRDGRSLPENFKMQYERADIDRSVRELGADIGRWAKRVREESHTDVIAIPVLRGGIFFFADLVRHIPWSVEIAPARSWTYEPGENAVMRSKVSVNLDEVPAKGRAVLLIDDICDSGKTLDQLNRSLLEDKGAREVRSAVLIQRKIPNQAFQPDWVGFTYEGLEWFVGYGMEDQERWRNLPDIYTIQQKGEEADAGVADRSN